MADLDLVVGHLMCYALAPTTLQSYSAGISCYLAFCRCTSLDPLPLHEETLQRFVACHHARLAYKTIKVYLAGVQYWSLMRGFNGSMMSMSRLYYLLRAVRRIQGNSFNRRRRLPITTQHLRCLFQRLDLMQYNGYQRLLFKAATTLAFFGLLRVSEYTSGRRHSLDSSTLLVSDVSFNTDGSLMFIHVRSSKTDPFRNGCIIRIARITDPLCPVTAMQNYLHVRYRGAGPLFIISSNSYLIRQDIVLLLRRCFPNILNLNTHSFRIGGASAAASAGIPDSQIQILGRWVSNAYRRYIHVSDSLVRNLGQALVSVEQPNRVWDPIRVVA